MDSVTQIALGAAVGEAVLGRKVGNKAVLWGAAMGTIPDLDVIPGLFLSEATQLGFHRGFSHSILFALIAAPILGWLIHRMYRNGEASWGDWSRLAFWGIFTHPILDCFTVYGTQLFQPFSNYAVSFDTIFIIDPLYTLPLIIGTLIAMRISREMPQRWRWNTAGLVLSTVYLLFTVVFKSFANDVFEKEFVRQDLKVDRYMSAAMPFNSLLWMAVAEEKDGYRVGLYSILDEDAEIDFQFIPRNDHLLSEIDGPAIDRLLWFSKGYYTIDRDQDTIYFKDLRFGRTDGWMGAEGNYIFAFKLLAAEGTPNKIEDFERQAPAIDFGEDILLKLLYRTIGEKESLTQL